MGGNGLGLSAEFGEVGWTSIRGINVFLPIFPLFKIRLMQQYLTVD